MSLFRLYNCLIFEQKLLSTTTSSFRPLLSSPRVFSSQAGVDFSHEILSALREQNKLLQTVTKQNEKIVLSLNRLESRGNGTNVLRRIEAVLERMEKGCKGLEMPKKNTRGMLLPRVFGGGGSNLLRKINARLDALSQQQRESKPKRTLDFVKGSWAFNADADEKEFQQVSCHGTILRGRLFSEKNAPQTPNPGPQHMCALVFKGSTELNLKTGIYKLSIRYEEAKSNSTADAQHAGIVIGEIEFRSDGYAGAEGADWDRLLSNQRQTGLPYSHGARGKLKWLERKISEPWEDEDILNITIDTNTNTVTFQRNGLPWKVLRNVLAFTNNRVYPEYLRVFAYSWAMSPEENPPKSSKLITEALSGRKEVTYEGPVLPRAGCVPGLTIVPDRR